MKRTSVTTFVFALLLSLGTLFFASGDACDKVPSMTREEVCLKLGKVQDGWYKSCQSVLRSAPSAAEVSVYALTATRQCLSKYGATTRTIDETLRVPNNLTLWEKKALDRCKVTYGTLSSLVARIANQLSGCDLATITQEYGDALSAVKSCSDDLWQNSWGSPAFNMVTTVDWDLTDMTSKLGAIVTGGMHGN
ncbi:unnamed protein product [Urochloa humidicola]